MIEEGAVEETGSRKAGGLLRSGHIQVAMATGVSIVVMAWVSKRMMPEPMPDLWLAVPPFIMTLYEGLHRRPRTPAAVWWVAVIVLATALVLILGWTPRASGAAAPLDAPRVSLDAARRAAPTRRGAPSPGPRPTPGGRAPSSRGR